MFLKLPGLVRRFIRLLGLLVLLSLPTANMYLIVGCGSGSETTSLPPGNTDSGSTFKSNREVGLDVLALQHVLFSLEYLIDTAPKGISLGTLDYTFGEDTAKIEQALTIITPKYFRTHLLDGSCVFNQNCGEYSPVKGYTYKELNKAIRTNKVPGLLSHVEQRTSIYCAMKDRHPGTKFLISPMLEHRLEPEAFRILADTVLKMCPDIQIVNNWHDGVGERYKGAWVELHGEVNAEAGLGEEINSLDGDDILEISVQNWLGNTYENIVTFAWTQKFNCRVPGNFIDPRLRTNCPSEIELDQVIKLLNAYHVP